MAPVIVLTTVAANFDARPRARDLVEQRLAACVNIVAGVTSIYRWKGQIEEEGAARHRARRNDDRRDHHAR